MIRIWEFSWGVSDCCYYENLGRGLVIFKPYLADFCQYLNVNFINLEEPLNWNVYLSGEIHTNWRDEIYKQTKDLGLEIIFSGPVTNHEASDDCGANILGKEELKFWHDHKGAKLNAIRTRKSIQNSDIVVVKFGEKYRQWNAAFDAGYASALGKSLIVIHSEEHQHALKEVDAAALAVVDDVQKVVEIFRYVMEGKL